MTKHVQVSTANYYAAHGHAPRGRGNWAFFFDGATDVDDAKWFEGMYSEAKAKAVRYAVEHGHYRVSVGS